MSEVVRKDFTNAPLCLSGRGVAKIFGMGNNKTTAVDYVDFDFHEGEFVSIVGESGSGKTTLSKMLLGLLNPSDGASYLAALASAGRSTTTDGKTAERVLILDDAGYIWMYQVYATDKGYGAKLSYFTSNLAELGVKFGIDENECRNSSMILTTEGDDLVLYLSAFTGKTNDVYRMVLGDDGEWIASKIGSFGEGVWPATIILGGQAYDPSETSAFAALDTMATAVSENEVASEQDFSAAKAASAKKVPL